MKITWYGTASVGLESGGTRLLFDPFVRTNKKLSKSELSDFVGFDYLLLTHGHFDHIICVPDLLRADKKVPVYCTATPIESLVRLGADRNRLNRIAPGEHLTLGPFEIAVRRGRHIDFDMPYIMSVMPGCFIRGPRALKLLRYIKIMPENNETVAYEIRAEGKTVLLLGSFGVCPGEDYPTGADLMVFPFSGNNGIAALAKEPLAALRPQRILFDHFDDAFPPLTKRMDVEGFCDLLASELPETGTIIPVEKTEYEV